MLGLDVDTRRGLGGARGATGRKCPCTAEISSGTQRKLAALFVFEAGRVAMNLFGRSKPNAAAPTPSGNSGGGNSTNDAIGKLRDASETMQKREEHLIRKIDNEIKQAKEFSAKGKKREALTCIKRKKMYEKQ